MIATYIEERQATHSAPDVKQQLAAVRMMFDWLIVAWPIAWRSGAAQRIVAAVIAAPAELLEDPDQRQLLASSLAALPFASRRPWPTGGGRLCGAGTALAAVPLS
jgi:hypothetical protein